MHRSGTSLATRALSLLGVSLGREADLMPPGPDNPAGYFENRAVRVLNDELLADLGGSWDQPPILEPGWEDDEGLEVWRGRARRIAETSYDVEGPVGWKDPRLSLLLPFWRTVVPVDRTVVVLRDPVEVVASLARRNRLSTAQAALLWLRYSLSAAHGSPGHLVLTHRELLDEPARALGVLADYLDLAPPDGALEALLSHRDASLHHHRADELRIDHPLVRLASSVFGDGTMRPGVLDPDVAEGLRVGWLRPPEDGEALAAARAKSVELEERLRRHNRARRAEA